MGLKVIINRLQNVNLYQKLYIFCSSLRNRDVLGPRGGGGGVGWVGGGWWGHGYKAHLIHVNFSLIFSRLGNFSFTLVKVLRLSYGCELSVVTMMQYMGKEMAEETNIDWRGLVSSEIRKLLESYFTAKNV